MNERIEREKVYADLLRRHRRTFYGHCKCGWRRMSVFHFGGIDYDRHIAGLIVEDIDSRYT